ncbi:MAG: DNA polymerase III subunit gamma/tau [bacterium]
MIVTPFRAHPRAFAQPPALPYNRVVGYQTLYRKYRSQTFSEVVGQKHVIRVLRGALSRGRIAHAYLMSGPRGTGKTSVARIFAKALNCPDARDGEPCGGCHVCTSIAEGRSPDVIEMDAASNRGVESIEELRRGVQFVPQELRYKVYIIDEVHMISTHGFNALLKTLEEPPSHAIFVLATTEPDKLPITILSRCLRFEFHRIPFRELADHLISIAKKENQALSDDAAMLLAELAEGSARDAISLLDQLIIAGEEEITPLHIRELFGLSHPKAVTELVRELVGGNLQQLVEHFREAVAEGRDPEHFLRLLYGKLRDGYLREGDDDELLLMLETVPRERLLLCVEAIWDALGLLRRSNHPVGLVELTLFKLAAIIEGARVYELPGPENAGTYRFQESAQKAAAPAAPRPERFSAESEPAGEPIPADDESAPAPQPPPKPAAAGSYGPRAILEELRGGKMKSGEPQGPPAQGAGTPPFSGDASARAAAEPRPALQPSSDSSVSEPPPPPPDSDEILIPVEHDDYGHPADAPVTFAEPAPAAPPPPKRVKLKSADRSRLPSGLTAFPADRWKKTLAALRKNYFSTYCLIHEDSGVTPILLRPGVLYLAFPADSNLVRNFCKEGRHKRAIEATLTEMLGDPETLGGEAEGARKSEKPATWQAVFDPGEAPDPDGDDEAVAAERAAQLELLFGMRNGGGEEE